MAEKLNEETAEKFASRLQTMCHGGYQSMAILLGVETGLVQTMIDLHQTPMTSQEIADVAGMKERYVREWLGAMVCAHIIEFEQVSKRYHLPAHRISAFQLEGGTPSLTATFLRYLLQFSAVFDDLKECMKKDGPLGIPYSNYPLSHELQTNLQTTRVRSGICEALVEGQPILKAALESGIRVLDVGCSQAVMLRQFAVLFPKSTFIGIDYSEGAIKTAQEAAKSSNLTNIEMVRGDACAMPADWKTSFDYVFIFDVLHDVPRPDNLLKEVKRVCKIGAMLSVFEPGLESGLALNLARKASDWSYTGSLFHCLPISAVYPDSWAAGSCWGKARVVDVLQDCGIKVIDMQEKPAFDYNCHFWCTA